MSPKENPEWKAKIAKWNDIYRRIEVAEEERRAQEALQADLAFLQAQREKALRAVLAHQRNHQPPPAPEDGA